ncbi:MAG: Crp/Fnr family transcriptional regulator [Pseudomonadota bacterium]
MDAAFLSEDDRRTIKRSVLCSAMGDGDFAELLASASVRSLKRSEYLFEQGDPATNLFLIVDGWVQITRDDRDGSHTLIAAFHKGDSLAESAAFLGKVYPASAQAMTDLRVVAMRASLILDIIERDRDVLAQTLASIYKKMHVLVDEIEWLKTSTLRERLARFLLEQTDGTAEAVELTLPYSKSLIAAKLGTSPQQLSRTFTELQQHGVRVKGAVVQLDSTATLRSLIAKS